MTIDRDAGYWEAHCDFCPIAETMDLEAYSTFHAVWTELRERGWQAELQGDGTWLHRCPSCVEEQSQEALDLFRPKGEKR